MSLKLGKLEIKVGREYRKTSVGATFHRAYCKLILKSLTDLKIVWWAIRELQIKLHINGRGVGKICLTPMYVL